MIGSCDTPLELNGVSLGGLTEDQLVCSKLVYMQARPIHLQIGMSADCTPACMSGVCNVTVGECECDDGYTGTACDTSKQHMATAFREYEE